MSLTATGAQLPWHDPGAAEEDKCCCGGGETCCLYPSSGIAAGDFLLADLPDAISYVDSGTPYSWGRLGALQTVEVFAYNVGTGMWESIGDVSFCYDYSGGYFIGYKADGSSWIMVVYNAGDDRYEILFSIGPCLITGDGNLTPGDDTVEDQFDSTYTLSWTSPWGNPNTATVVRTGPCSWEGTYLCTDGANLNAEWGCAEPWPSEIEIPISLNYHNIDESFPGFIGFLILSTQPILCPSSFEPLIQRMALAPSPAGTYDLQGSAPTIIVTGS